MSFFGYALMVCGAAIFAFGHQILVEEVKWGITRSVIAQQGPYGVPDIIITDMSCCKGEITKDEIVVEDK